MKKQNMHVTVQENVQKMAVNVTKDLKVQTVKILI